MFRIHRTVLSLGAGALVLGALILAAPRAAHGIAATLVQVTNTAANPVVAQSPNTQAAQLVHLYTNSTFAGNAFWAVAPAGGYSGQPYIVPANQSLVITSVDITLGTGCSGNVILTLEDENPSTTIDTADMQWVQFASPATTNHYAYPSGFVIATGVEPVLHAPGAGSCNFSAHALGYLTSN